MVERRTVDLTMIGASTRIYRCWMREHTSPPYPSGFAILLARDGIRRNISWSTKSIGNLELTAGLGFGRLSGRSSFPNPFGKLSNSFKSRQSVKWGGAGQGGTITGSNWFTGPTSAFYGIQYQLSDKITILSEYTPDLMLRENSYINVESPWNFGASYQLNDYVNLSAQYLHGSQVSLTAHVSVN